ncbi:hypothetical protein LXL04_030408 [Taraxacum kok-saghyz]
MCLKQRDEIYRQDIYNFPLGNVKYATFKAIHIFGFQDDMTCMPHAITFVFSFIFTNHDIQRERKIIIEMVYIYPQHRYKTGPEDGKTEMSIEEFTNREELREAVRKKGGWFATWKAKRNMKFADVNRNGFIDKNEVPKLAAFAEKELNIRIHTLDSFLKDKGIEHNFSAPYTPQQNGVVERRNRTLCEAARSMLIFADLPQYFWAEAIATTCYTQNRSLIHKHLHITPYEVINNRKPNIKFFHIFGCR